MTDTEWTGAMPAVYDRWLGPALFAPFAADLAARVRSLQPQRVLELAAGTGIVTRALVDVLPGSEITATDVNEAMVAHAAPLVPEARWRCMDAQALDLPDASFDLVVCQFGVMFFPDRPAAHAEARRVLRPGGQLLFDVWDVVEASTFPAALVRSLHRVLPQDPPEFVVRTPHGYTDVERIRQDLVDGGLVVDAVERKVLPTQAGSAHALAQGFCQGTPLRFELERRGDLGALTEAIGDAMTELLGEGPVEGDLTALVVTAHRPDG